MSSTTAWPGASALLVMDFQNTVVDMVPAEKDGLLARTARLLEGARAAGARVIHVIVGFRPGYPELSSRNQVFAPMVKSGRFAEGDAGTEVHPAVAPRPGEVVIAKRRVSAFFGTELEVVLRAGAVETLVLAGVATSGVVLSTVRHATDADYRVVVVQDCCADPDPEVHRLLLEKVFARWTTVVKVEDLLASGAR